MNRYLDSDTFYKYHVVPSHSVGDIKERGKDFETYSDRESEDQVSDKKRIFYGREENLISVGFMDFDDFH